MRLRLAMSPRWVQGLVYGLFFGAGMTAFSVFRTGAWLPALAGGLVGGVLFGLFMGRYMSKLNTVLLRGLEGFSPADQRTILRGSWRGPIPTDSQQREAAGELLQRRRDNMVANRRWSIIIFAAAILLYIVLAVTQTWLWWFGAALFLVFLILTLTTVPRMDRRLALLTADTAHGRGTPSSILRRDPSGSARWPTLE